MNMNDFVCPGRYCGRLDEIADVNNNISCGACPRGWRTIHPSDKCIPCTEQPTFYDWLFMTFMAALPLFYHWYYIEYVSMILYKLNICLLFLCIVIHFYILLSFEMVFTVTKLLSPIYQGSLFSLPF